MIRTCLIIVMIGSLMAAPAYGDGMLATVMDRVLTDYGFIKFSDKILSPQHIARIYLGQRCSAGYVVNTFGELEGAMVTIMPGYSLQAYYGLGAAYMIVQTKMGKLPHMSSLAKEVLRLKGYRLLDAITTNLKRLPETTFRFDDMIVYAIKDEKTLIITISLWPALK